MSFWTADRNRAGANYGERINELIHNIEGARKELIGHPVYTNIQTLYELYIFMQHHVFAVWDFMSLLKSLQRMLSCVEVPWIPVGDPNIRRLVNDIVMSEETDEDGSHGYRSHFELYLGAMRQAGADTGAIDDFISRIQRKESVSHALDRCGGPAGARRFVQTTFEVINSGALHRIAACFTFGREDVVPEMFRRVILGLRTSKSVQLDRFIYYLDRHIAVDTNVHGPMAFDMIAAICGDSSVKWKEAAEAAGAAIRSRVKLWDSVVTLTQEHRARDHQSSKVTQMIADRRERSNKITALIEHQRSHYQMPR